MKNLAKLIVIFVFALGALFAFFAQADFGIGSGVLAQRPVTPTPTPAANVRANTNAVANANTASNVNAAASNANAARPPAPATGDKKIQKSFTLNQGSESEYGDVAFDHETHASKNYSPDGKSVIGCAECHHTDQPKSALKLPLVTSERDVMLTFDVWKASTQKINECRACHFRQNDIPDGKTMPTAAYTERGKSVTKDLNNELAYHINCNTCHDSAASLRPALKSKPGFATATGCTVCHKAN